MSHNPLNNPDFRKFLRKWGHNPNELDDNEEKSGVVDYMYDKFLDEEFEKKNT